MLLMFYIVMSTWDYQCSSKCFSFLQISTDGYLVFGTSEILPYNTDHDTSVGHGTIFYREVTSGPLLAKATKHVRQCNSGASEFSAQWLFIATWDRVTYYEGDDTTPVSVGNMTTIVNTLTWTVVVINSHEYNNPFVTLHTLLLIHVLRHALLIHMRYSLIACIFQKYCQNVQTCVC